ncbi:MAG: J domain-containing protein [Bacteroidia bacterium]|nr:J domain-containing protein [Bacteroidia bacterium]
MRDFYQQLGVNRTASAEEIKRAYRKLAVDLHPDKTNDPVKIERFKEITEAYNTLSDIEKKWIYDQQVSHADGSKQKPAVVVPKDPVGNESPAKKAPIDTRSAAQRYSSVFITAALLSLCFCIFLVTDFLLPGEISQDVIASKYASYRSSGGNQFHKSDMIVTGSGATYEIPLSETENFRLGGSLSVYLTALLHIPRWVANDKNIDIGVSATIYKNFLFAPVLLFAASMLAMARGKSRAYA